MQPQQEPLSLARQFSSYYGVLPLLTSSSYYVGRRQLHNPI